VAPSRKPARPRTSTAALERCLNVADLEVIARRRMPRAYFDYYAGGAEDERTLAANRAAFDRYALFPRVLVDVSRVDLAVEVLGARLAMPILLAPAAYQRLAHPEGEIATARAAGAAGTLMAVSTLATASLEEVAAAAGGPLWFQLYVYRDRAISKQLIARAEAAGYRALVVTVDTPRLGRRERDLKSRFTLPRGVSIGNFKDSGRLARWDAHGGMAAYASRELDPSLTWEALEWMRGQTRLPIVVKGVLRADDAARAAAAGVAGVWVSNHGGRQLDGAQAAILALPAVVAAVGGRAEVYVDGGFRRGADVLKALALGARAAFIARPYLWGLAAGGEPGVRRVLDLMRDELEAAMALAGCPAIAAVDTSLIGPA
jgi:4-hydroxymandelate oxidase